MGCCGGGGQVAADAPDPHTFFFKKRGCTDVCCLIFFFIFWGGMSYITYLSVTAGDPYSVFYGSDYLGQRCGVDAAVRDKPKTFFPRIDKDLVAQSAIASTMPWKVRFYGLCVESCPNVTTPQACFDDPASCRLEDYGTPAQYGAAGGQASYYATMPSLSLMNRCIPTDSNKLEQEPDRCAFPQCDGAEFAPCDAEYPKTWVMSFPKSLQCEVVFRVGQIKQLRPAAMSPLSSALGSNVASVQRVVEAIADAWRELLIFGLGLPVVLGFAWLILLRLFAGIFTYVMITAIGIGLFGLTLYLYVKAGVVNTLLATLQSNSTVLPFDGNQSAEALEWANNTLAQALGLVDSATSAIAGIAPSGLSDSLNSAENEIPLLWWILAVIMSVVSLVYLISMCAARKQIKTAIALVKQGSVVVKDRPAMMFFPFASMVIQLLLVAFVILTLVFLGTAKLTSQHFAGVVDGMKAGSTYLESLDWYAQNVDAGGESSAAIQSLENSATTIQGLVYLYFIFGFLWTLESMSNIGWAAMSGSVSHWYFFRDDESAYTKWPLARSLGRVFRFHLGSIFFGSFIIAFIQILRLILLAIDKYTKKQQDANLLLKVAIKCTQCCMWCLEKTIKFITDYCYIYVAMQGSSFCKSCFLTFSLIVKNPAQLAINTFVRTILSWIQLLALPIVSGWLSQVYMTTISLRSDTFPPTLCVALMAYVIAKVFSLVFSCVLDTLFVCCARDKAEFKGKFMPDRLKTVFGFDKKGKQSKQSKDGKEGEEGKAPPVEDVNLVAK